MFSRVARVRTLVLFGVALLASCTGGGSSTTPGTGSFDLRIIVDKTSGPAPLAISFFATPSGGTAPYTYAWDFNNDGVIDSNAASGQYVYQASSIAKVTVTDKAGVAMTASQTITITPPVSGGGGGGTGDLVVRFNASPQVGQVPFAVQFSAVVSGGRQPYQYQWDFQGDGIFDSFVANPLFTYTTVGQNLGNGRYVYYPVLKITDARGVAATNLDDKDENGLPDFRLEINALPPNQGLFVTAVANPQSGQAPLSVEFTAAVSGAAGDVQYTWHFGDNTQSTPSTTSLVTHSYDNPGTFLATVTAHDLKTGLEATSAPVSIDATQGQPFQLTIGSDIAQGQVPFVVNFTANPVNGQEPIQYEWDVFDNDPANPNPDAQHPPSLNGGDVVTPFQSLRKDPSIHFGNVSPSGFSYRVRCSATDARGNQKVSSFIVVTALPHTQPAVGGDGWYSAKHPVVIDRTIFPVQVLGDPTLTANAAFESDAVDPTTQNGSFRFPQAFSSRANAAMVTHPSGVTFIIGGERLAANGSFQGLVGRGDSCYAYVPAAGEGADPAATNFGKYGTTANADQHGGMVRLNDGLAPPFPNSVVPGSGPNTGSAWTPSPNDPINRKDTVVPPFQDMQQPPAVAEGLVRTQRSTPFTIVGSAAACLVHESPETNDKGLYPPDGMPYDGSYDPAFLGLGFYNWPDNPLQGWNATAGPPAAGIGSPVIYVLGGRVAATTAASVTDTLGTARGPVQKYYVYGFGGEDLTPMSQDHRFQATGNQCDIWSNYFLRPDTDQFPGAGINFDPQIQDRRNSGGAVAALPMLPDPLYGEMAVRIESGVDLGSPSFPNSPFHYIFIMGGISGTGNVIPTVRYWDTSIGLDSGEKPGAKDGVFSKLPDMPHNRAYGHAVFVPGSPSRIVVVGGFDELNQPLDSIDIYTFASVFQPVQGSWSTFGGTLPEALRSTGAGYNRRPTGEDVVAVFGGFTVSDFTYKTQSVRLGSGIVADEPLSVVPRANGGSGQGGGNGLPVATTFNRYYLIGGVTENGTTNIVEVASLP